MRKNRMVYKCEKMKKQKYKIVTLLQILWALTK